MSEGGIALTRSICWLSLATLLAQQAADAAVHSVPWPIWVVKLLPLLLFVPGMLRDNLRSHIWLCFVCLGYFAQLVLRLFVHPDSALLITGMVAVVVLFVSAMLYVRWRARWLRSQSERVSDSGG
ncbi:MAG: DUF2069 domain-containing protein [Pseudomonadota bacterium]